MAKKALVRGPDIDSAIRGFDTGQHLDGPPRGMKNPGVMGMMGKRSASTRARTAANIRRPTGSRRTL